MRMPPRNFPNEIAEWRAQGYEPSPESLAEYDGWNRPRVTGRATMVSLVTMAAAWVWITYFKGKGVAWCVAMILLGFVSALWTMRWEWQGRRDAEDRLRREYAGWLKNSRSQWDPPDGSEREWQ